MTHFSLGCSPYRATARAREGVAFRGGLPSSAESPRHRARARGRRRDKWADNDGVLGRATARAREGVAGVVEKPCPAHAGDKRLPPLMGIFVAKFSTREIHFISRCFDC